MPGWKLILYCLTALGCMQSAVWLLARGLRLRLERRAVLLGLALPLAMLAPWLPGGEVLAPTGVLDGALPGLQADAAHRTHLVLSDAILQFVPWELEVRRAFGSFRLPLWSDRLDGGSSPWLNPQAAVLSPIALLARPAPIAGFFLICLALKILLSCEGTWLLARRLGRTRWASLLAAASFALGGGVMSWALFPHSATVAWVPWLALAAIALTRHPSRRSIATGGLIVAALLLSGHPETAAAGGLFAAVCGVGLRRRRTGWTRSLSAASAAALLGLGLAAPQIVPFVEALADSQRARDMAGALIPPHGFHLLQPASWFLHAWFPYLRAPINPLAFGVPYDEATLRGPLNWVDSSSGYTGLVAFAGAAVALLAIRDRRVRPFLGFAAVALLLTAGFLPLAHLLFRIPLLRIPAWSRLVPVTCLALSVAGAFGCDLLLRPGRRRLGVALALGAAAAISLSAGPVPQVFLLWGLVAASAAIAASASAEALTASPSAKAALGRAGRGGGSLTNATARRRWGALLLLAAVGLDLVPWSRRLLPRGQPDLFFPPNLLTARLQHLAPAATWRTVGADLLVYPSLLPAYGLADIRPNNVMAPAPQLRVLAAAFGFDPTATNYYAAFPRFDHPLLSFLNVRCVVTRQQPQDPRAARLVTIPAPRLRPFTLLLNPRALPRWFLPTDVDLVEPAALDAWIARMSDPARVAVFPAEARGLRLAPRTGPPAAARLLRCGSGHLELEVPGQGERLLATSLPLPAGWSATATDGRRLRPLTIDGAFLGIVVPAGSSRLTLDFAPPGFGVGLAGFAAAVAALLAMAAAPRPHLDAPRPLTVDT